MAKILSINIGSAHIKISELTYSGHNIKISKIVMADTPGGTVEDGFIKNVESISEVIKKVLTENKITTKTTIFSVFSSKIATKEVIVPEVTEKKLEQLIEINASEYFPVNIDDFAITHKVLEKINTLEETKELRVNVIATPNDVLKPYTELAKKLDLKLKTIDFLGNSTVQFISKQIDETVSIVVEIGEDSSMINILKNNVLSLQRIVPYGKNIVVSATMEERNVEYGEAEELLRSEKLIHSSFDNDYITDSLKYLINNITRVVDYYNSRNTEHPIEKAYLTGESEELHGIESLFVSEFNFSTMEVLDLKNITLENEKDKTINLSRYLACIGAGIDPINILPKEITEKVKTENSFMKLRLGLYVAIGISAALVLVPLMPYLSAKTDRDDMELKVNEIRSVEPLVNEMYNAKDIAQDILSYYTLASNSDDGLYILIEQLEEKMPSDISISSLTMDSGKVSMSCLTSTKQSVAKFIQQLKEMTYVNMPYVSAISESVDADGITTLTFNITFEFLYQKMPIDAASVISD